MDTFCLREASDSADFDVDDAASTEFQGSFRIAGIANGFVQADPGPELFLQAGMKIDVVVPQWLFDHHQVELIELPQVLQLPDAVGRIGVTAERDLRPARADSFEHVDISSSLYFDFDAAVSGGQFAGNFVQQLVDRVLDANRYAARDFATASAQKFPERLLLLPGFGIPHGVFQRRFCHAMSTNRRHEPKRLSPLPDRLPDNSGGEE